MAIQYRQWSLLHHAAQKNAPVEVAAKLLEFGLDVNQQYSVRNTSREMTERD